MIEPRLYRAAFVPAVLALFVAMFSLESRPSPLPQGLAADVLFDGRLAARGAAGIAERHPDRRPGTVGDRAVGRELAGLLQRRGFRVEQLPFTHAGSDLLNVVGRRAGRSRRLIAIVAARDSGSLPDATGSAADSAALLELARVFEGRPSRKTLVLASVDGSTLGEVGATRLAEDLGDPALVDAVLVVSNLGARSRRGPLIVPWSNDARRAGIGLQRTIAESIRQELQQPVGSTGSAGQVARLSFPLGIGAQGVLLERGFEAVRISGSGELPPAGGGPVSQIDENRLGGLGRAALRTVTALDSGQLQGGGPETYVVAVSQVLPGRVLGLLGLALLLPVSVAGVDAFARVRRRRIAVTPWLHWLALWVGPLLAGLLLFELLALAGATPDLPSAPVAPTEYPLDGPALAVLAGTGALMALLWLGGRLLARRADLTIDEPAAVGAGAALVLVMCVTAVVLWIANPYAALMLVPAAHLWMIAVLTDPPPARRLRLTLILAGALPPLVVAVYYLIALSLDPLSGAWYLLLLVGGGAVGPLTALAGCVLFGLFAATVAIGRTPPSTHPPTPHPGAPSVFGPGTHAGPGSLRGTGSSARR